MRSKCILCISAITLLAIAVWSQCPTPTPSDRQVWGRTDTDKYVRMIRDATDEYSVFVCDGTSEYVLADDIPENGAKSKACFWCICHEIPDVTQAFKNQVDCWNSTGVR